MNLPIAYRRKFLSTLFTYDSLSVRCSSMMCSTVAVSILWIGNWREANPIGRVFRIVRFLTAFDGARTCRERNFFEKFWKSFLLLHKKQFLYNTLHSFVVLTSIREKQLRRDIFTVFVCAFLEPVSSVTGAKVTVICSEGVIDSAPTGSVFLMRNFFLELRLNSVDHWLLGVIRYRRFSYIPKWFDFASRLFDYIFWSNCVI